MDDIYYENFEFDFYDLAKILTNASFFLVKLNPFLDIITPKNRKMVEIVGVGVPKPKPVSDEFDELLSSRKKPF
uniref:Skp1 domain-containing protein n=1 Tax=Strongyloides papillosus TaxID=174720 RepID=A0A0N5C482_STREA